MCSNIICLPSSYPTFQMDLNNYFVQFFGWISVTTWAYLYNYSDTFLMNDYPSYFSYLP